MPSKKTNGPGGVPWAVVIPVVHTAIDLISAASCPRCGSQVVLYVCFNCHKPVQPRRSWPAA